MQHHYNPSLPTRVVWVKIACLHWWSWSLCRFFLCWCHLCRALNVIITKEMKYALLVGSNSSKCLKTNYCYIGLRRSPASSSSTPSCSITKRGCGWRLGRLTKKSFWNFDSYIISQSGQGNVFFCIYFTNILQCQNLRGIQGMPYESYNFPFRLLIWIGPYFLWFSFMKFSLEKYMAEVVILVNALISNLLQSLRHSVLVQFLMYWPN